MSRWLKKTDQHALQNDALKNFLNLVPTNAPVVSAEVEDLLAIVTQVSQMGGFEFHRFLYYLDIYEATRMAVLVRRPGTLAQQQALRDNCEALRVCFTGFQSRTIALFYYDIQALFTNQSLT